MKSLGMIAFALMLMGATVRLQADINGTVFLDDNLGQLWAGDPTTATYTLIGTSATAANFGGFTDIAFANGVLYGLSPFGELYSINTSNGQIIADIGNTGAGDTVGLAGNSAGVLWAGGVGSVFTIKPAVSAVATQVGAGGGNFNTEGDLDFDGGGNLWLTSATPAGGALWSINQTTGAGTFIGQLADPNIPQAFGNVFGVAYDTVNNVLYGYDVTGNQFAINTANPGNSVSDEAAFVEVGGTPDIRGIQGAAFTAAAIIAAPEPSTFVFFGTILFLLAVAFRRTANRIS